MRYKVELTSSGIAVLVADFPCRAGLGTPAVSGRGHQWFDRLVGRYAVVMGNPICAAGDKAKLAKALNDSVMGTLNGHELG